MATGSGTVSPVSGGGGSSSVGLGFAQPLTRTLLPISRYAEIMGIRMPHFWQQEGNKAPVTRGCSNSVWDHTARADLAWVIAQAEELIAIELGYWPAPKFITNELAPLGLAGVRSDWRFAELSTEFGHVQSYGVEQLTLKLADATVTYQALDGNPLGRQETATVEVGAVSACDSVNDIAVFFRTDDGAESAASPNWEIRPLKKSISNGVMSIKGEASMFLKPSLMALTEADCKGSDNSDAWKVDYDPANLVSQVDVYCRTVNTETPTTLQWDGLCSCAESPCSHETQAGCAYSTDAKRGFYIARPATWNGSANIEANPLYRQAPESILVNYQAGLALDSLGRINSNLERAIIKLTNALLPEPPCGFCDDAAIKWSQDRETIDPLTQETANLPWDVYKVGALEAWRIVKRMMFGRGTKLGRGYI